MSNPTDSSSTELVNYDPAFPGSYEDNPTPDFENMPYSLQLPALSTTAPSTNPINDCRANCAEMEKNHKKECDIMRTRVEEALKARGCPSRVIAIKKRSSTRPCKKSKPKKKSGCGCR